MATSISKSTSLKDYLKKYENNDSDDKKKKKKKKMKTKTVATGVLVVDEDPVWQKPVKVGEEENEDESADEEKPQIDEDIEVKRMKRLEQIRSRRPYHAISEDGSGWVTVSDNPKTDSSPLHQERSHSGTPLLEPELNLIGYGNEDPDLSPPRQRRKSFHTSSAEPEPKPLNSTSLVHDLSPPRHSRSRALSEFERKNSRRHDSPDSSLSLRVRGTSTDIDFSHVSSAEDLSPPRKSRNVSERPESPDLSPPRRHHHLSAEGGASRASSVGDLSPPRKGKKDSLKVEKKVGGLMTKKEIHEENARKKKEEFSRFKTMDPSVSGRGADPVYRDKTGQRISKEELSKSQKGEEKPKEEKPKEKKLEWGKGLAQKREAEAKEQELELEMAKPFARTRDDPDLDKMMKERLRWGDPMAHLVKRKQSGPVLEDFGDNEKMKESGFIIPQDIPNHSWIKRGLDAAPNRYGIKPGRHWDGVDRSNGYEKEYYKRMNEKNATQREAYLWSVSDM